jgi:ectoine hydroxylase-related dioxygenase (phytanoyl-CoA dioxygenase family)
MNPRASLELDVSGNWGRFNFDSSVPGTYQDIRVGRLGAIISLPGAAEQALHTDTPHLFEIDSHLPPHYINVFAPTTDSADGVGQTAFVHASHRLNTASRLLSPTSSLEKAWHGALVRPRLEPGDVLLFDCRILHFGLANESASTERPILYTNITLNWFTDPKNWDNKRRIFSHDEDQTDHERAGN